MCDMSERAMAAMIAAAGLLLLAGCGRAAPAGDGLDCLYGPEAGTAACERLDDDPERCAIEGGLYDAATRRCIR